MHCTLLWTIILMLMENGKTLKKQKDITSSILRSLESNYPDEVNTCVNIIIDCLALVSVPLINAKYFTEEDLHRDIDETLEHVKDIFERKKL